MVALTKRPFAVEALQSVVAQTGNFEKPQLVVVAGFEDSKVEQIVKEHAGTWIHWTGSVGEAMLKAVLCSAGDIICFLDDDDVFMPNKLARVTQVFSEHPDVGYYHNAYERVDEFGRATARQPPRPKHTLKVAPSEYGLKLGQILRCDGAHNLSSISVRRDCLLEVKRQLSNVEGATDRFVFYAALSRSVNLVLDADVLTKYRIHPYSEIHAHGSRYVTATKIVFALRRLSRTETPLLELFPAKGAPRALVEECSVTRLKLFAVNPKEGARPRGRDFANALSFFCRTRDGATLPALFLALVTFLTGCSGIGFFVMLRYGGRAL